MDDLSKEPAFNKSSKPRTTFFTYYVGFMAVIGGFLFGYDTGVVSSAMLFVPESLHLNYIWTELIVSVTVGACAVFSLVAGVFNDWLGRRKTILVASFLFTIGAIVLCLAPEKFTLLVGRIIVGAAVGLASMTVPIYIAELCPAHLRGAMVTGFQLMITFGLFIASVLGGAFSYIDPYKIGWRLMMGVAGIPSAIQFIGFLFLPESPRWLSHKHRDMEVEKILKKVYHEEEFIVMEMNEINANRTVLEAELKELGGGSTFMHMIRTPHVRKALILGCSLQAFQQLAGVNTLMYYTATIINMSGVRDAHQAIWLTCVVTGVNFLFTFIPIFLVERLGRRILWLGSLLAVIGSTLFLAVGFLLINRDAPLALGNYKNATALNLHGEALKKYDECAQKINCDNCVTYEYCGFCYPTGVDKSMSYNKSFGWCLPISVTHETNQYSEIGPCHNKTKINLRHGNMVWAWNFCPSKFKLLPLFGMICYMCSFASGTAPMPWVINSEIYPYWARSTGIALATFFNWLMNLVIAQTFLTLTEAITKYGTFFVYTGISCIGFVVFFFVLPETKGIRIEEVEEIFGKKPNKIAPEENYMPTESKF